MNAYGRVTKRSLILAVAGFALVSCSSSSGGGGTGGSTGSGGASGGAGGGGGKTGSSGSGQGGNGAGGKATGGNTTPTSTGGAAAGGAQAGGAQAGGSPASGGTAGKGSGGNAGAGGVVQNGGAPGSGGQTGAGGAMTCTGTAPTGTSFTVDKSGVTFTVGTGKTKVQVCAADIIRVMSTGAATFPTKTSMSVGNAWDNPPAFCVEEAAGTVTITTTRLKVKVTESTGIVSYTDTADKAIVAETAKSATGISTEFTSTADEALFGLGQRQDGNMNMKGKSTRLQNANTNINIPVLVSNKGYGLFWDNPSVGNFTSTASSTKYTSAAGDMVDYYFFYGPTIDQVIAGYRTATGAAPMFPKWAYGLFQSRDHYSTQAEVLAVKDGYRNAKIPVDCIVQDWFYWGGNGSGNEADYTWGSHIMAPTKYPDPKTLVDTLHSANIHGMISIWPEYEYRANPLPAVGGFEDQANYKALDAIKALFPSGGSNEPHHFYDVFNADARTLVYQQIYDRLLSTDHYGWDGIWADNTEPQAYPNSLGGAGDISNITTSVGKGSTVINAYPLQHVKALYEGWRKVGPNTKRVYVLTRSAWAGSQRYGASVWSGDIDSSFGTYAKQIPAGLNIALAGYPYWTTDIGGYTGSPTDESFTRWFQFGAFNSIFRIHGQAQKELYHWSSATTKANLLAVDTLHYRLMPYLYSLAWKVHNEGYTIMRHLVFDYPTDTNVFNIGDQFMYGPAILVNPVTSAGATSRSVYLPAGTWYDFWTGATATGGAKVTADAPLSKIPLYVKAGSIVPMGPNIQYATESIDPLEIRVYKGANGSFTLYEDEGDTYNYETGKYATVTFTWDDTAGKLSISDRSGSYTGMPASRTFNVVWVDASHGAGTDVVATPDQAVKYDGTATSVSAK